MSVFHFFIGCFVCFALGYGCRGFVHHSLLDLKAEVPVWHASLSKAVSMAEADCKAEVLKIVAAIKKHI